MVITAVITEKLAAIVLALTPLERLEAARRLNSNFMTTRWFVITGVVAIIILTVLFLVVSLHRMVQERKVTHQLFIDYAEKRGLSEHERQILLDIASKAKLKRSEAIFTMGNAFERGAAKVIEESSAQQGAEKSRNLGVELLFLREKLGFQKRVLSPMDPTTKLRKMSSRQIPVGKELYITRRKIHDSGNIESTVIKNDYMELTVQLATPVESTPGESWRAHYYFGTSAWEFDTSVVRYNGGILVLNHSDNARFINRRRFLRVRVNKPAFITNFPFARTFIENSDNSEKGSKTGEGLVNVSDSSWGPPEFVPAIVTELAGPGLRIEAPLKVKTGDRVLITFKLDEEKNQDDSVPARRQDDKASTSKIIEDIGKVKHTEAIENGFSIAVELIGLGDSDINELIRATNAASLKASSGSQDISDSTEEHIQESATVQGV